MIRELTNHLWQSTLFAVAAGLLTVAFRRNRAQVRYWLWLSASLKFLVPFTLLTVLGSHLGCSPAVQRATAPVIFDVASFAMTQPFPNVSSSMPSTTPGTIVDWVPLVILGVWVFGFGAIALIRLRDWRRIRAAVRASSPWENPAPVEVRSSPGLLEPGVCGLFRSILLLPADIRERLTPFQLEAVLAHELCHVRRRDNLTSAIHMIVEAVFWFHPLVWWIGARLVEERERACDEEVLLLGSDPRVYAEGILTVCKSYLESPLPCVSGVTGSNLKRRIRAILTGRVPDGLQFAKKAALAVAGTAGLTVPVVIGMMNAHAAVGAQKFEVATVKRCTGGVGADSPGRMRTPCTFLVDLINHAYVDCADGHFNRRTYPVKLEGLPAWATSDLYQIEARTEGTPGAGMMNGPMFQSLLEERFALKIHAETREGPAWALTVAKGGFKLSPFQGDCTPADPDAPPEPIRDPKTCRDVMDLDAFSVFLGTRSGLGAPVINKTGITGNFHINLEYARDLRQLGLKLEAAKGPHRFLVVDRVERPSAN